MNECIREKELNRSMWRNMEFVNFSTLTNCWMNIATVLNKNFDLECEWRYVATVNKYIRNYWEICRWMWICIHIEWQRSCWMWMNIFVNKNETKRLSLIVRVNVVLNRTVVVDSDWRLDNLCGSHLQSQSELCHVSWWYYTLVIDLIGQWNH